MSDTVPVGQAGEELCNRWMELSAWMPFYRNHHTKDDNFIEPYLWETVTESSRKVLAARYSLLPYWVRTTALHRCLYELTEIRAGHAVRRCVAKGDTSDACAILGVPR